jgi:hypothetical protein
MIAFATPVIDVPAGHHAWHHFLDVRFVRLDLRFCTGPVSDWHQRVFVRARKLMESSARQGLGPRCSRGFGCSKSRGGSQNSDSLYY